MRALIAGMGSVLRGDDGFGVEVARRLAQRRDLPPEARVIEIGVGGIQLVQELMSGYELLVIADAVAGGRPPGTLVTLAPVPAVSARADPHATAPTDVVGLAHALGVLPPHVVVVGCEPLVCDDAILGLSPPVAAAADEAAARIVSIVRRWLDGAVA